MAAEAGTRSGPLLLLPLFTFTSDGAGREDDVALESHLGTAPRNPSILARLESVPIIHS